ncbi:MAG: hypothetical protein ABIP71_13090 [Verrucomicrobiota bacterium]
MTRIVFGFLVAMFLLPSILRWHHFLLIASWNMSAVVFLLPGKPPLWLLLTAISLVLSLLSYTLDKRKKYLSVPSVLRPLLFLGVVVLVTAELRGGIRLGSFGGDSSGGKKYIFLLGAILAYFALTWNAIATKRAHSYVSAFFWGGATSAIGNLLPLVNPAFYFIFAIFPPEQSGFEALGVIEKASVMRLGGLTFASMAIFCTLLARYGISGVFDISSPLKFLPFQFKGGFEVNRPWRLILFVFALVLSLFGGYRLVIANFALIFSAQFYYENLFRTRLFPAFIFAGIVIATAILPMADKLPLAMQRAISFLPVDVDPVARSSADSSTEWRLTMWKLVLPQVPDYLFLGKGYALNSHELEILVDQIARGQGDTMEMAWMAGDYHNGPLSVIMPLGIWGVIGFIWFLVAAIRALSQNYRFSDPALLNLNRFLLVFFIARTIHFFIFFGSLYSDLVIFTGIIGLSISLNGGVLKTKNKPAEIVEPAAATI